MPCDINDIVLVKIKADVIQKADSSNYDRTLYCKIIGMRDEQFVVLIYKSDNIENCFHLTQHDCIKYGMSLSHIDELAYIITSDMIPQLISVNWDGMVCLRCHEPFPMAEANQSDKTFKCYQCRMNPWR